MPSIPHPRSHSGEPTPVPALQSQPQVPISSTPKKTHSVSHKAQLDGMEALGCHDAKSPELKQEAVLRATHQSQIPFIKSGLKIVGDLVTAFGDSKGDSQRNALLQLRMHRSQVAAERDSTSAPGIDTQNLSWLHQGLNQADSQSNSDNVSLRGSQWLKDVEKNLEGYVGKHGVPGDIHSFVQSVLRESYLESTNDLRFYAEKVKFFNNTKKQIRDELNRARMKMQGSTELEADARMPDGELIPTPIETTFNGLIKDGDGEFSAEIEAALAGKAARQEKIDTLTAQWEQEPRIEKAGPRPTETGTSVKQATERLEEKLIKGELATLSPQERTALEEKLRSEGATITVSETQKIRDGNHYSLGGKGHAKYKNGEQEKVHQARTMYPGETIEQYIDAVFARVLEDYDATRAGSALGNGVASISFPDYLAPPPIPSELAELTSSSHAQNGEFNPKAPMTTKGELENYIEHLEETLQSVGDDAQLANVDLQNILQKQQQTIQQMSNMSKLLHDTMMAIIRNTSG
jgi:hypothetical protein